MPTQKSDLLRRRVVSKLESLFAKISLISSRPRILSVNGKKVNLRVTTEKAGAKFWFDVTPDLYEQRTVDFFFYACGSEHQIYIFPVDDFADMIAEASIGGVNQVPNFTIFSNSHEFEPAGRSFNRYSIYKYFNEYSLLR